MAAGPLFLALVARQALEVALRRTVHGEGLEGEVLMATPMLLPGSCALCFGPHGGGSFDVDWDTGELTLVNVCIPCRFNENYLIIWKGMQ
jgi:hypothetical protein